MTVRGYRDGDLDACRTLWVELTQWHRDIYDAPEIGGGAPEAYFDEHLERVGAENLWVAEEDGAVVGFVGMIPEERTAELEPIVVAGGTRGRGIGRELAAVVLAEARRRGLRQVVARPAARNAEALRFFHAQGFDVLGQVELVCDLVAPERWRPGEKLAGRDFRL
jgi:N-acetylglutamate synthase-like GNAT family acetyltransferase